MDKNYQLMINGLTNITTNDSITIETSEWFSSDSALLLFFLYAIVIFSGVFGNATLIFSICSQPSGQRRKPLLFSLCIADLLVVLLSAPLSIVFLSLASNSWPLKSIGCKMIQYLKVSFFFFDFCNTCLPSWAAI